MATVSSFESMERPAKADLKQFALLFQPLFQSSTLEARRAAVAALSQSPNVPEPVALFIASQPISIAASFLTSSPCLTDELLLTVARTQGKAHVRAIVRRESLSPAMIDALVGLRFGSNTDQMKDSSALADGAAQDMMEAPPRIIPIRPDPLPVKKTEMVTPERVKPLEAQIAPAQKSESTINAPSSEQDGRRAREEMLRQTLKALDRHLHRTPADVQGLRRLSPIQDALLVRFARTGDASAFATVLADALSSSRWLAERILLDLSGRQLATTLLGLTMSLPDITFVLSRFYPHLREMENNEPRMARLIASLDGRECQKRIETWLRADNNTYQLPQEDAPKQQEEGDDIVAYLRQYRA
ncbi:DUF2336 domain-containing protein [Rhizobium sp.]|jgi:uncharacterized protein (DUF2336 family)|uniref:DUF2336 domain-containing protein n=1 Tax=Rhizobium sp. TaxID=391 RepID=UPI000E9ECD4C|nr:hypothetical protein [Rhizobium sp.]